ncbi:MAG: hypothetical protein AB8C95_13105 [Phycisphaeraceae bacterium]
MNKEIFFIENEVSSVIHAAMDGVVPASEQMDLLQFLHEDRHKAKVTGLRRLFDLSIPGAISLLVYLVLAWLPFSLSTKMLLLVSVVFVAEWFNRRRIRKQKRRYLSQYLRERKRRPNICLICFSDLREIDTSACPACGEELARSEESLDA